MRHCARYAIDSGTGMVYTHTLRLQHNAAHTRTHHTSHVSEYVFHITRTRTRTHITLGVILLRYAASMTKAIGESAL